MNVEDIRIGRAAACRAAGIDPERHSIWTRRGLWSCEPVPRAYRIAETFSVGVAARLADVGFPASEAIEIANRREPWCRLVAGEARLVIPRGSVSIVVELREVLAEIGPAFRREALAQARDPQARARVEKALAGLDLVGAPLRP